MADVDLRTAPTLPDAQRATAILPVAGTAGEGTQKLPLSDVVDNPVPAGTSTLHTTCLE